MPARRCSGPIPWNQSDRADRTQTHRPHPERLTEKEMESFQWLKSHAVRRPPSGRVSPSLGAARTSDVSENYPSASRYVGSPDFTAVTNKSDSEEARSAVSKDGRWLGLACGRPSRRAQSFEARAPSGARAPQDEVRAPQDEAVYASI